MSDEAGRIVAAFLLCMIAIAILLSPIAVAAGRNHSRYDAIKILSLMSLIVWPLWIVAIVWAYSENNPAVIDELKSKNLRPGFPVIFPSFRVNGIKRKNLEEVVVDIDAASIDEARSEAERMGFAVISVEKVPTSSNQSRP